MAGEPQTRILTVGDDGARGREHRYTSAKRGPAGGASRSGSRNPLAGREAHGVASLSMQAGPRNAKRGARSHLPVESCRPWPWQSRTGTSPRTVAKPPLVTARECRRRVWRHGRGLNNSSLSLWTELLAVQPVRHQPIDARRCLTEQITETSVCDTRRGRGQLSSCQRRSRPGVSLGNSVGSRGGWGRWRDKRGRRPRPRASVPPGHRRPRGYGARRHSPDGSPRPFPEERPRGQHPHSWREAVRGNGALARVGSRRRISSHSARHAS